MPKVSPIQNAFNAGEISPLLYGRTDFDSYKSALKVCLNQIPLIQGGTTRRPGTYFCNEVKDSDSFTRLIPFKYSTTQAYMLEFGHHYIRFIRNNVPITATTQGITAATQANPVVITYSGSDTYTTNDHIEIDGVLGMTELNGRRFVITNTDTGTNELTLGNLDGTTVDGTNYEPYVSGGTVGLVIEIASLYDEADLPRIKYTQSADVLYLVHPDYQPHKLSRTSHTAWTLTVMTNTLLIDGPYFPVNSTVTTLTPSSTTAASMTVTASAVTGINGGVGFKTTDVGRLIRIKHSSTWGYVIVLAWVSTTVVTCKVVQTLGATTATADWRLGLYSTTTGYPAEIG